MEWFFYIYIFAILSYDNGDDDPLRLSIAYNEPKW